MNRNYGSPRGGRQRKTGSRPIDSAIIFMIASLLFIAAFWVMS